MLNGLSFLMATQIEPLAQAAAAAAVSQSVEGGQSNSFVIYGSALAAVVAVAWALLERWERRDLHRRNIELSLACQSISESHFKERVQAEERHMLTLDSSIRNVLESLERAALGKPKL